MDIEMLEFRCSIIDAIRLFFKEDGFLEVDTPSLCPNVIPESSIELFRTDYINPYTKETKSLFLLPSPELYIKQLIAQHKRSFFQISKCYRNCESIGKQHNPEFTMLEYYTIDANYINSIEITRNLLLYIVSYIKESPFLFPEAYENIKKGFVIKSIDELFIEYAQFSIAKEHSKEELINHVKRLQPSLNFDDERMSISDLYDMIFVHAIEKKLPKNNLIIITDYPYFSSCLAKEKNKGMSFNKTWKIKERWELYGNGIELCNCYTEERNKEKIEKYFKAEEESKKAGIVQSTSIKNFPTICSKMPPCSGVAMGIDRLIMFLSNRNEISSVIPFPLQ